MIRTLVAGMLMAVALTASAQAPATHSTSAFAPGYNDVGPTIGLGGIGSANISFGGRFEHGIQTLPSLGNGILGVEVSADFYSYSTPGYSWRYTPLGVTANYHFQLDNAQVDPFLGIGLGYDIITCSYSGFGTNVCSNSNLYFIGRAGVRYFFQPSMALYGDVGAGAATLNVGIMFKLR